MLSDFQRKRLVKSGNVDANIGGGVADDGRGAVSTVYCGWSSPLGGFSVGGGAMLWPGLKNGTNALATSIGV